MPRRAVRGQGVPGRGGDVREEERAPGQQQREGEKPPGPRTQGDEGGEETKTKQTNRDMNLPQRNFDL